jgi:hypothetical protein
MSAGLYSDSAVRYFGKLALIATFPIQEGFVSNPSGKNRRNLFCARTADCASCWTALIAIDQVSAFR